MTERLDIVAIGNALVDFLCPVNDNFLYENGLKKGNFQLISLNTAQDLYKKMGQSTEMSGGSAANTIASLAALGCKTGFIGSVAGDQVGAIFAHDIRSLGVEFSAITHNDVQEETGRCYILVTNDAQRTMNTYLGVAGNIPVTKIDFDILERTSILYIEGYMWVIEDTKQSIIQAIDYVKKQGGQTAFTLSDKFCVDEYRKEFLDLIMNDKIDIIFANEQEAMSLFQKNNFDDIISLAQKMGKLFIITRGEMGSVIIQNDVIEIVSALPVNNLVDTTGAGDSYAAGFLYGLINNMSKKQSAEIASLLATDIIQKLGARSNNDLILMVKNHINGLQNN